MKTKICYKCKKEKYIKEFSKSKINKDGYRSYCKLCRSIKSKKTLYKEKQILLLGQKELKYCPKCHKIKLFKLFYKNKKRRFNLDIYCKKCKKTYQQNNRLHINEYHKKWAIQNRNKIKKFQTNWKLKNQNYNKYYHKIKRKNDVLYKIRVNLSLRVSQTVKNYYKSLPTMFLVGCAIDYLMYHLQSQFKKGMSWDNYGSGKNGKGMTEWHIDHIKPCASFDLSKPEEQRKCFHYSNLQPLWAYENLRKGCIY